MPLVSASSTSVSPYQCLPSPRWITKILHVVTGEVPSVEGKVCTTVLEMEQRGEDVNFDRTVFGSTFLSNLQRGCS